MKLNDTIFPNPTFSYDTLTNFNKQVIYIPKDKEKYYEANNMPIPQSSFSFLNIIKESDEAFIPCLFLSANRGKPTNNFVLMFHGNGEDIFYSFNMADGLRKVLEMNVIVVEYPGYSIYKGDKSSKTIQEDSLYVYEYLKKELKNVKDENIFVFGRSIGSGPAVYLASKKQVAGLFLVSAFTSVQAIAKNMVGGFFSNFVKERFSSGEIIKNVQCPIMFIHGKSDTLIPFSETDKLFDNCAYKEQNEKNLPEKMTHNNFDMKVDILDPIKQFIQKKNLVKPSEGTVFPVKLFDMPSPVLTEYNKCKPSPYSVFPEEYKV